MRILYVHYMHPESARGGMGVHIHSSTDALRALGHEVSILSRPQPGTNGAARGAVVDRRSRTRQRLAKYAYEPRALLRSPLRIPRELSLARAWRPDVAVVRYEAFEYQMWVVAALLNLPLVIEVNATTRELVQWKRDEVYVWPLTRRLETMLLRRADRVFAVSNILKGLLVEDGLDEERIAVIPNGADPSRFRPDIDAGPVRRRYGLDDHVVVGFLGSFGRWYDIGSIADIVPSIVARHPQVRFLLAGAKIEDLAAPLREKFEPLREWVIFTGVVPLDEAPQHIAAMDVALSLFPLIPNFGPSVIKLFEYMAAARAVVATDIGQQGEMIRDGVNGMLVWPNDTAALAEVVDRLIREPALRARLGAAARLTILQHYTWAHNAQRIADLCALAVQDRSGVVASAQPTRRTES